MKCQECGAPSFVKDSRQVGNCVRRTRVCQTCDHVAHTEERWHGAQTEAVLAAGFDKRLDVLKKELLTHDDRALGMKLRIYKLEKELTLVKKENR